MIVVSRLGYYCYLLEINNTLKEEDRSMSCCQGVKATRHDNTLDEVLARLPTAWDECSTGLAN